jgi:hypothetical protein
VLPSGARKALASDRVVLRPGPPHEVAAVRRIFHRFVRDGRSFRTIARELNADGLRTAAGRPWRSVSVRVVLTDELMIGQYIYNRTSLRLGAKPTANPPADWVRIKLFPPIVPPALFRRAQARLADRERERKENGAMLAALRQLRREGGVLTSKLVNSCRDTPAVATYAAHFGSLSNAYAAIGYVAPQRPRRRLTPEAKEAMLDKLRQLYAQHGYISLELVDAAPNVPWGTTYRHHFGSLTRAYALAGLQHTAEDLRRSAYARSLERGTAYRVKGRSFGPTSPWRDDDLLALLRRLFARDGYVSCRSLRDDPSLPQVGLYASRFGSFANARERAGLPRDMRIPRLTRAPAAGGGRG